MDLGIKGRTALVTAASRGLGMAVARQLAMEGATVAIASRDEKNVEQARAAIEKETGAAVAGYVADVTDADAVRVMVRAVAERFGSLDILVCNAGGPPAGMYGDFTPDDYRRALELNLVSTITLSLEALPYMRERRWGRIVNITSISARQPIDNLILSNTARAGVLGFAKSLSNQVAPFGITVNSVCPGYTRTERVEELAARFVEEGKGTADDFYRRLEATIPAGRVGTPEEFAQAVAFLVSEGAGYITGVALQIDGGFYRGIL